MNETEFDEFVLANMPYYIAVNYQHLLETQNPLERVNLILHIYNLVIRTLTINLVSQYLIHDREDVNEPSLNDLLLHTFPSTSLTLDIWQKIFFTLLKVYKGNSNMLFMPELYNFYWDTSKIPQTGRVEVEQAFERMTQIALGIQSGREVPQGETEWREREVETIDLLKSILSGLSFFRKYDLIRVLDFDTMSYSFELHKGVEISVQEHRLPSYPEFERHYFYWRTETEEFLPLNPMLVFWETAFEKDGYPPSDTGIYDRFFSEEQLRYLLSTLDKIKVDDDTKRIKDLKLLLHVTLEVKSQYQVADRLTWLQLDDICRNISESRMSTISHKFQKELYLQRDKTHQEIEKFLQSKKRCFVLIGKSGVGKSNFLLALGEELRSSRDHDICVLMYDGANLNVRSSVTGVISQDFDNRLKIGRQVQNIWREINNIDRIEERLILLCVDAINENTQATELLRQLNDLVQEPWPWLKIVFSSRPETWQSIKRGVKLSEALYYQEEESNPLEVGLEPFSYSEQIEPFSRQELPQAYAKYQQKFELQTPYGALSIELRGILQEPLNLWLVASTNKGKAIPPTLKVTELVEQYVNKLVETNRLQPEDLRFLRKQLIPLMVRERHYSNEITAADIDAANDALHLAINSAQILSNGQQVNQSFTNLLNADILVRQQQRRKQKIVFKYERFYEYFVGERIAQLSETQTNRYAFFLEMIDATTKTPFLWGAVRNTLAKEAKTHEPEVVLKLCFTDQQRIKDMMVSVLTYLGWDNSAEAEGILKHLLPPEKKATELGKIRQLLGRTEKVFDSKSLNAAKSAIEVASNLNIPSILQSAALQADPTIRTTAVRYTYHLWQRDQKVGLEILEYVANNATTGLIPNFMAIESALGLSALIFFEHSRDQFVLERLQSIWRKMIANILRIQEGSRRWKRVIRRFIRERIVSFIITIAFRYLHELPDYNVISYKALEAFFQLGVAEKSLYRNLVQYLDIQGSYSTEQMEDDYLKAIKINNLLLKLVVVMGLTVHAYHAPIAFLPYLKKLFEEAKSNVVSYPYLTDITKVFENVLDRTLIDEVFEFFVYTVEICQEYYARYPQTLSNPFSKAPEASYLGPYAAYQYRRMGTARTEWLETRIQKALSQNNLTFFNLMLTTELPLLGIEQEKPLIALDVLVLFFHSGNPDIYQMIQSFLARLRVHYPHEVDDFLEEQHVPDDFRLQVQTNEPPETIGGLIGQRSWYFLRDDVLVNSSHLQSEFMEILVKAADCEHSKEWLNYFLRTIINLIYGGEALRQSVQ